MRLNSIRARMTALFTFSVLLLMLLACGGIVGYAKFTAERSAEGRLNSAARQVQVDTPGGKFAEALDEMRELADDDLTLMVVDAQGKIVQKSRNRVPDWPLNPNDGWRVRTVVVGPYTVVIGLPEKKAMQEFRMLTVSLAVVGLSVVLAAAVGAWLLVGRVLSPIGALAQQAQSATADSLLPALSAPSQDAEIVGLVGTLNDLLQRQSQTAQAKGRFYAAASHELRTPLQALSGHLELSLSKARTQEERHATIKEAYTQTRRLVSLVCDLLTLNKLDFASSTPPVECVSLSDICAQTLTSFQPMMESRDLHLQADLAEERTIAAPRSHVEMLVRNLIENAVKYATPGGEVCLELTDARLLLSNSFPTLLSPDTSQLFEPFFRPDVSRNSETGGNGLGLAICHRLAVVNGWHISLHQDTGKVYVEVLFASEKEPSLADGKLL